MVKITFESDPDAPKPDRKEMASFLEKLRSKFRIVALSTGVEESEGATGIAYTSLAHSAESLTKQLDAIAEFCETQGFGRISDEAVLMDDIDSIGELTD